MRHGIHFSTRQSRRLVWVLGFICIAITNLAVADKPTPSQPINAKGQNARLDYMLHCQGCHGMQGNGLTDVPALRAQVSKFLSVPGGRAYLAQVPGVASAAITDAALANLMNWLLAEFNPRDIPAEFSPYQANEMATYRASPLIEVAQVRAQLLRQISALKILPSTEQKAPH